MKKITFTVLGVLALFSLTAQNNTNPFPTSGNVGIGTGASQSAAVFNLQLHGTTDYTIYVPGSPAGLNNNPPATSGYTQNVGKTARLGLTNTTSGATATDGGQLRMSERNFYVENLERRDLLISSGVAKMTFSGDYGKISIGNAITSAGQYAELNIRARNGLFIETFVAGDYGASFRMKTDSDNAIQVMGTDGTTRNFSVQANGLVYARKYTTTLSNIPDYVFDPAYKLMSFADLRVYLELNKHLPNVPSATEYEATGVDLGEMNRILLEKTEELTLYILQLEERLKKMETALQTRSEKN